MPEFDDVLKGRRSIRKYEDREVPQDVVNQILEAVKWSPSWANTQVWEIVVVRDQAQKDKLQAAIGSTNPAFKATAAAPVVLVVCGKTNSSGYYNGKVTTRHGDWMMFDLGIAAQSICLAAQNLGLGTVIVGMFDHNKAEEIVKTPEGVEVACIIPMGYPAQKGAAPKRREIEEFSHQESF